MIEPRADAVVFDFDGVIIDSREPVRLAITETLVEHGFARREPEQLDRFIGPPVLGAFAELTGEPETAPVVTACADTYHRHYERVYLERTTLFEGIDFVLAQLTLPLALATAKPSVFVAPLLESLGLAHRFRHVFAPAMSALDEPKTMTVAHAVAALGAHAAVVIGDRAYDVEAAHANGARAIGVTWGIGDRAELEAAGAEMIIDQPVELLELLQT